MHQSHPVPIWTTKKCHPMQPFDIPLGSQSPRLLWLPLTSMTILWIYRNLVLLSQIVFAISWLSMNLLLLLQWIHVSQGTSCLRWNLFNSWYEGAQHSNTSMRRSCFIPGCSYCCRSRRAQHPYHCQSWAKHPRVSWISSMPLIRKISSTESCCKEPGAKHFSFQANSISAHGWPFTGCTKAAVQ